MSNKVIHLVKGGMQGQAPARAAFSKQEAAASLGISTQTLDRMWKAGKIRSVKIADRRMFPASELLRVAEQGA